jgi:hypothetical protein
MGFDLSREFFNRFYANRAFPASRPETAFDLGSTEVLLRTIPLPHLQKPFNAFIRGEPAPAMVAESSTPNCFAIIDNA